MPQRVGSFFLSPTSPGEVAEAINSLKQSRAVDIYNLNSAIIKHTQDFLVMPLTSLFNLCFEKGLFPDSLKISRVIPIFKKGENEDPSNYRPISIIPIFGKVLEVLLKTRLTKYFEYYKILSPSQFGFRAGLSTIQAVSRLVDSIVGGFEEGKHTALTLCDLSKAFDCVNHDILLHKMEHYYGFRGVALDFFKSYFSNRSQCVGSDGVFSSIHPVKFGVPQGSVVGPIMFTLYINDLYNYLLPESCILFADDTTLSVSAKSHEDLRVEMSVIVGRAREWFNNNQLSMNEDKTQELVISSDQRNTSGKSVTLLGVIIDDGLTWHAHVDNLCKRLSSSVFLLRQLRGFMDLYSLLNAYYAFFYSHLSYGVILWGNSSHSIRVFRLQKRAVRVMVNVHCREHCRPIFIDLKILTLPSIYILNALLEIHKNKHVFALNSDFHYYNTRGAEQIRPPQLRLQKSKNNSLPINLYNKLQCTTRNLNLKKFKTLIKNTLLEHGFYSIDEFMSTPLPV